MVKIRKLLNAIFPPFSYVQRGKPRYMIFVAHDTPDLMTTIVVGAQHVLVVLMMMIPVVFVGQKIGYTGTQLRSFVSIEIVVIGLVTLLQSLRTRFSSGHLVVQAPNLVSIAALAVVVLNFGIEAATGAYILSGVTVIVLSRFLPKLQKIFPPEVTGILLVLLSLTLITHG